MCDKAEACVDCKCTEEQTKYEVTLTLSDKCWNEEFKVYLLVGLNDDIIASETNTVTLTTTYTWRIMDMVETDKVLIATVKKVV